MAGDIQMWQRSRSGTWHDGACNGRGPSFTYGPKKSLNELKAEGLKICQRCLRGNGVAKGEVEEAP